MRLLKKASYKDIINEQNNVRINKSALLVHYKEYELYLSQTDLEVLYRSIDKSEGENSLSKLIDCLVKSKSVITAIHCPESYFKTINDQDTSSNYLSFCEILDDEDSKACFIKCIVLADYINSRQYKAKKVNFEEREEDDEEELRKEQVENRSIVLVIHEGCSNGCTIDKKVICRREDDEIKINVLLEEIRNLQLSSEIRVAIENVTPFYCEDNRIFPLGENCGWKFDNQFISKKIKGNTYFKYLNNELKNSNVNFGLCVDFCHIIATCKLNNIRDTKTICKEIEKYFLGLTDVDIYLYHVSNLGAEGQHGANFDYDKDDELLGAIREWCCKYGKCIPITLEMEDGQDKEKACRNFNLTMYAFSKKHVYGRFGELLNSERVKEVKDFFDNLFFIYTCDFDNIYEISKKVVEIKKFVLSNTNELLIEKILFGFREDGQKESTALLRLKAYIYYTRFCNLGHYLAENHYKSEDNIFICEKHAEEDFALSMTYFVCNDVWNQCVYTGVSYKFLIDFLPKKDSFYRFNDGIVTLSKLTERLQGDGVVLFKNIVDEVRKHIGGEWKIENGRQKYYFYSVGKNFGNCLFKYYNSRLKDWHLRIYNNVPTNYIKTKDKNNSERIYSIQAYLQKKKCDEDVIGLSMDISSFSKGRDGNNTDSLNGFIKEIVGYEICKEKVASISDGEILYTELPEEYEEYYLPTEEAVILKKMYVDWNGTKKEKSKKMLYQIECGLDNVEQDELLKSIILKINDTEVVNKLNDIMEVVKSNAREYGFHREKESNNQLEDKVQFMSDNHNEIFKKYKETLKLKKEINS